MSVSASSALQHLLHAPALKPARGSVRSPDVKRIVVTIDAGTFDRMAMLAAASRVSFAEATRQLLERGLEDSGVPRRRRIPRALALPAADGAES